jgi:hypothetical protein
MEVKKMYFIIELQTRPDGIVNSTITSRSSLATGLALYYERASKAVTSTQFTKVALTLQDDDGNIIENKRFDTLYEEE